MKVIKSVKALRLEIKALKEKGQSLGFVPTMGALHAGHISLIENAKKVCDHTICSIFVNPKQFNDEKDFQFYPRQVQKDLALLRENNCDIAFTPEVNDVFPDTDSTAYNFGLITSSFEGTHRPGHFNGVASVVKRFLEIIEPDKAFFGRKDYQQLMLIKSLVKEYNLPVEIIGCEIIREKSGLAMSSRNKLLNLSDRQKSLKISATLFKIYALKKQINLADLIILGRYDLNSDPEIELEYFDIVDLHALTPVAENYTEAIVLVAARVGGVRLIDNIILKK